MKEEEKAIFVAMEAMVDGTVFDGAEGTEQTNSSIMEMPVPEIGTAGLMTMLRPVPASPATLLKNMGTKLEPDTEAPATMTRKMPELGPVSPAKLLKQMVLNMEPEPLAPDTMTIKMLESEFGTMNNLEPEAVAVAPEMKMPELEPGALGGTTDTPSGSGPSPTSPLIHLSFVQDVVDHCRSVKSESDNLVEFMTATENKLKELKSKVEVAAKAGEVESLRKNQAFLAGHFEEFKIAVRMELNEMQFAMSTPSETSTLYPNEGYKVSVDYTRFLISQLNAKDEVLENIRLEIDTVRKESCDTLCRHCQKMKVET